MSRSHLDRLTVLGAGVLGGQIGWHSAFKGKTVVIYDPFPEALQKAKAAHDTYAQIYRPRSARATPTSRRRGPGLRSQRT